MMKKAITQVGADNVFLVVIDGGSDWTATETMIQEFFPWISFLHCVSHEVSLIIKDCFKEDGGIPELTALNDWITSAQHWFSSHSMSSMRQEMKERGEKSSFVWPAVTRYAGVLLKIKRFHSMKPLLRRIVNSGVYVEKNWKDDEVKEHILGADKWQLMERVITIMGPLLLLCRLADGQKPVIGNFEIARHTTVCPPNNGGSGSRGRRRFYRTQNPASVFEQVGRDAVTHSRSDLHAGSSLCRQEQNFGGMHYQTLGSCT